jgi:hypothetical protein
LSQRLRLLALRPSIALGVIGNIVLGSWTRVCATVDDVQIAVAAARAEAEAQQRIGHVIVVHADTPLPDEKVRAAIQREMQRLDPRIVCGATVITREGFAGSAMRAVSSTLQLLSRPTHPEKIVATAREGIEFVRAGLARERLGAPTLDEAIAAYEEIARVAADGRASRSKSSSG